MKVLTVKREGELLDAYLVVFHCFATDKYEVAANLGISPESALKRIKQLELLGVVERYDVNDELQGKSRRGEFKPMVFQCLKTYDYVSEAEAVEVFRLAVKNFREDKSIHEDEAVQKVKDGTPGPKGLQRMFYF